MGSFSLTPMRFEEGAMEGKRSGRWYRAQRLFDAGSGNDVHPEVLSASFPK